MRAEQMHKIIPVKSLLENQKQIKKQFRTFNSKQPSNMLSDPIVTPKAYVYHNTERHGAPLREYPVTVNQPSSRQHFKGISVGKKVSLSKAVINQYHKQTFAPSPSQQFQEYYTLKTDQKTYQQSRLNLQFEKRPNAFFQNEQARKSQNLFADEQISGTVRIQRKDSSKFGYFNRLSQDAQKNISKTGEKNLLTNKFEEQVWNISTYQKSSNNDRKENHSIFKDELSKIKTELFQKEAFLIEKNKELEKKDLHIKEITVQLQSHLTMNENMKKKIDCLVSEIKDNVEASQRLLREKEYVERAYEQKCKKMQQQLKNKEQVITNLRTYQGRSNQQSQKQIGDYQASIKLLNLKIRQFQCEQKERTQLIANLKQKQKRTVQSYQIKLNGISEVLRQKQQQLSELSATVTLFQSQVAKVQKLNVRSEKEYLDSLDMKEVIIRQLSEEISDLKDNLRSVQIRMRQMIQNQEQLKKQLDKHQNLDDKKIDELNASINIFVKQLQSKEKQISSRDNRIRQQTYQIESLRKSVNEQIQLKNRFLSQSNENLRKVRQLQTVIKSLEDVESRSVASSKERQLNMLKPRYCKLVSENQRLGLIIKELNYKLRQFYHTNCDLNNEIIEKDLAALNRRFMQKC